MRIHTILQIIFLVVMAAGVQRASAIDGQTDSAPVAGNYKQKPAELTAGQQRQATLVLLASELLTRSRQSDDISLVISIGRNASGFECTGNSAQSIAACEQRCLAIQTELEDTNAPEGGCSSINNGCECTHDPFE